MPLSTSFGELLFHLKLLSMRQATYQTLPLEALHELLTDGVKKLLSAYELDDGLKEFNAHKKYIEVLIGLIDEKKKATLKITLPSNGKSYAP